MNKQPKMKKLFLDFCKKNGLKVEDLGFNVFGAYIPHQYFTCEPDDLISFMEYSVESHCICFETCLDCYYDALNDTLNIEFSGDSINIYTEKDFKLVEETYKNIMSKLKTYSVLIKEMKINERKKSLEQDFQKETN